MKATKNVLYGLWVTGLLASASVLAGHPGCGPEAGHDGMPMHGRMWDRMVEKLDLSEQQQEQIKGIRESARERVEVNREAMKASRDKIQAALAAGADETKIQQLLIEQSAGKAKAIVARAQVHREIQAVLTDEQREKLAEMKARKKAKMEERSSKHQKWEGKAANSKLRTVSYEQ